MEEKTLLPILPRIGKFFSKIVVIVSVVGFWIIGLNSQSVNFRDYFYIPFLLLFGGFFLGLLSYDESRDDKGKFRLGTIALIVGYNFLWFMIYFYITPLSGIRDMISYIVPPLFALSAGTGVYLIY